MRKGVAACGIASFLALSGMGLAQPARVDWWDHDLLLPHVDTFAGDVLLIADFDGRVVVAVDEGEPGERNGMADNVFLFQSTAGGIGQREVRGSGVVRFWHDGLRVSIPAAEESIELLLEGAKRPRATRLWTPATASLADGVELVQRSGVAVERLALDDAARASVDLVKTPPIEDPDPGNGGSGGSCARSCSVGCDSGSCNVSCVAQWEASCLCLPGGLPTCRCLRCN
jgi:hypothetical protein